ncbi:hypothetical protein, partial [Micromonospora sp. NPDC092111]|uniref:hypothetical protein n=1 Tax=Micromonospora sp. NPDC092111 TaxID=3364289 RepID=UPI00382E00E1
TLVISQFHHTTRTTSHRDSLLSADELTTQDTSLLAVVGCISIKEEFCILATTTGAMSFMTDLGLGL